MLAVVTTALAGLAGVPAVGRAAEPNQPFAGGVPEWLYSAGVSLNRALQQGSVLFESASTLGSSDPACALTVPRSELKMTLRGCSVIASETGTQPDPVPFWGEIDCADDSRHEQLSNGGDPHRQASGIPQEDASLRRLTVLDGDDLYGERCELGENEHRNGSVDFYREGVRRATFVSLRLPSSFPLDSSEWQNVLQMKQSQPADNGGGTPVLSLKAFDGEWMLFHSDPGPTDMDYPLWSAPAQTGRWTRFAFDVTYSQDPDRGSVMVYADLNGDLDFDDSNERSARFHTNTLKAETEGTEDDGLAGGDSIPSHLRAGIYHNTDIDCPEPSGCSVEIDNVQVLAP